MWDFIISYWIEFLFGIIAAGIVAFGKLFWNLVKKEEKRNREELVQSMRDEMSKSFDKIYEESQTARKESKKGDLELQNQIDIVKQGILYTQGEQFKKQCIYLLEENHEITLEEYQEIDSGHEVYNALGGNHTGDHLFSLVKKKAENILTDTK